MDARAAPCDALLPLAGHRVGITADRRAEEQGELLKRMGAEVTFGPVMRTLPLGDDATMHAATRALLADPPDHVLLTTGIGVRSWLGAAETWGVSDELVELLDAAPVYARGPKAYAAAMQLGVAVERREPTERLDAMVDALVAEGVAGQHVAIQLYGSDVPWATKALTEAGARVTAVPVYRWVPPDDDGPARRLIRETIDGQLTAITFTCPSAVVSTCRIAEADGVLDALIDAFRTRVAVACVGPVTEAAAREQGFPVACAPASGRLGLLVRSLSSTMRARHVHLVSDGRHLVLQGGLLLCSDAPDAAVALSDRERQVLGALARRPGVVVSRPAIQQEVWGSADEDGAFDAVLSRLRRTLAPTSLRITTRLRRGYLLEATAAPCSA